MALKKTSIYLDDELDRRLADRAAEDGVTKADFIRRTLTGAVQRPKRPKPSIAVFRSQDGLNAARDMDAMTEGFGEE